MAEFPWRAIGGSGRSGTSLAAERIATHPEVVYFQEPFWFCDRNRKVLAYLRGEVGVDELRKTMSRSIGNVRAGFKEQGEDELVDLYAGLDPVLARLPSDDRAKHVHKALEAVATWAGRRYWIEKTPHNVQNAEWIMKVFPGARIVHMIREPKDICASLLRQHWGPKSARGFAAWYREAMTAAWEAREAVPAGQYLVVEMETLVRQPHMTLESMLQFFEIEHDIDWLHKAASWIDPKRAHVGRYEVDLAMRDQQYVDKHCRELYETWRRLANG